MVKTSTTSLQLISDFRGTGRTQKEPTPTWSDRLPLMLLALDEGILDPVDRAPFADSGSIHNAIGKVHHKAVARSRGSGAQGDAD